MADWPLVGRDEELRLLTGMIRSRDCSGVVVAGPAGIGKTRLGVEVLRAAEQLGMSVSRIIATRSAATLPFGVFAPLLPAAPPVADDTFRDWPMLLRQYTDALLATNRSSQRRLLLMVDDAHLLDDASATLIHQLAESQAMFLLLTVRSGEPAPDPVTALWKDGRAERVELVGLTPESVDRLLGLILGGTVERATAVQLAVRSQGNALLLRELVLGAHDDGSLSNHDGIWRLTGRTAPSQRLLELVGTRLAGLDRVERELLELVSFAEPLGRGELERLGDGGVAESLERKGLLSSRLNGRRLELSLAHPLYGDVLRAASPALRSQNMARSLAEVVESTGARRRQDTLQVATWRLAGGGGSAELLLAGALNARWHYDFRLADRLAEAARAVGAGFDAAVLVAQLASLQGDGALAEEELAGLEDQATTDDQRGIVALTRVDNAIGMGRVTEAVKIVDDAAGRIGDDIWRDELLARRPWLELALRGPGACAVVSEPLLERAKGKALVWACIAGSWAARRCGRVEESLEIAARGFETHAELKAPLGWYPWIFHVLRCGSLIEAGRSEEARLLGERHYHQAVADRSPEAQAYFAWQLSAVALAQGAVRTATRYGREAVAAFRSLGRPLNVRDALLPLATALMLSGQRLDAERAVRAIDELHLPPARHCAVDLLQTRAWVAVAGGDLPAARRLLDEAATLGVAIGDVTGAHGALHDLGRLGEPAAAAARRAELDPIDGGLAQARSAHMEGLATADPILLEEAAWAFEAIDAALLAAEATADAAAAWRRIGRAAKAAAVQVRALTILERCEGASTPALQTLSAQVVLTPAERQAALMAAAGRTNKEIADTLTVSVRTVENNLQRAYQKLGISSRRELPRVLRPAD